MMKRCTEGIICRLYQFPFCDRLRLHSPLVHSEQGGGEDGRPQSTGSQRPVGLRTGSSSVTLAGSPSAPVIPHRELYVSVSFCGELPVREEHKRLGLCISPDELLLIPNPRAGLQNQYEIIDSAS